MADPQPQNQAAFFSEQTLAAMTRHDVTPSPQNYEIWYTYFAGTNPDASRMLDEHLKSGVEMTSEFLAKLHEMISGRSGTARAIQYAGVEMAQELGRIGDFLHRAGQDTSAYGDALEGVTGALEKSDTSDNRMCIMLEQITQATRKIEDRTRDLEEELDQSTEEVRRLRETLEVTQRAAITDGLTGLTNRRHFDNRIADAVEETDDADEQLSVIIGDIDFFKAFNDKWGHLTGDQVLRLVGGAFKSNVKGRDTAARYGGEEFAVIFPQTALADARIVADQIREMVEHKKIVKKSTGQELGRITMSFGVAEYHAGEDISDLIQRADEALFQAKTTGRNKVVDQTELDAGPLKSSSAA